MTQSRNFSATWNNPSVFGDEWLEGFVKAKSPLYAICQLERGEKEGTPHLQIAFGFKNQQRLKSIQKFLTGMHVEPSRNALKAYNYCKKPEGRVDGPWTHGVPPAAKNIKGDTQERNKLLLEMGAEKAVDDGYIDLKDYGKIKANIDLYKNCTADPQSLTDPDLKKHNHWIYGRAGVGKTRTVVEKHPGYYEKDKSKYWNGYTNQEVVLIDDLEKAETFMLGNLKKWCQHKEFQAEDKFGQMRRIRPQKIYVTSNWHPNDIWTEPVEQEALARRFTITHLVKPFD